jgi:hypothetical protein
LSSDFVPSVPQLTETTLAPRKARYISFNIFPQRIRFASLLGVILEHQDITCFGALVRQLENQSIKIVYVGGKISTDVP